jgi:opacity protein-like surface antigen
MVASSSVFGQTVLLHYSDAIGRRASKVSIMKIIRILVLGSIAALPFATFAQAADPVEPAPSFEPTASELGVYFRADAGWSALEWSGGDDDSGWTVGGGIGYRLSDYFRSDLTLDWAGDYNTGVGGDLSATSVMGNAYFDLANDTIFTPYIGAGVGYAWVDNNPNGVALGLNAGVAVDLSDNLALDVGYRFRDVMSKGPNPMEHQLTAGMRFTF